MIGSFGTDIGQSRKCIFNPFFGETHNIKFVFLFLLYFNCIDLFRGVRFRTPVFRLAGAASSCGVLNLKFIVLRR